MDTDIKFHGRSGRCRSFIARMSDASDFLSLLPVDGASAKTVLPSEGMCVQFYESECLLVTYLLSLFILVFS